MQYRSHQVFTRRRFSVGRWIVIGLALIVLACTVVTVFDNGRVAVRAQRVYIEALAGQFEGFTLLHISDLNGKRFGPGQKQLANALKDKRYSAVCITGDMVGPAGDETPLVELLLALDPTRPVYLVAGDADPIAVGGPEASQFSALAEWVVAAQQARGNVYFLGAPQGLPVGNGTVWFSDAAQQAMDIDAAFDVYESTFTPASTYYLEVIRQTRDARERMREDDLFIALSHNPVGADFVQRMQSVWNYAGLSAAANLDLVLAGGTLGGQWRLPLIGPVWYERWFPPREVTRGLQYAGSISLMQYISAGLGTNADSPLPDFRLFNTPEVSLITFTGELSAGATPEL